GSLKSVSRLADNAGCNNLAPLWIGNAEDCRFEHRRMLINDGFDLAGIDVFATRDDHVLRAIKNVEITVSVAIADVSRTEHSISEDAPRTLGIVPVTAHDIGTTHHEFPVLPCFDLAAYAVHDSKIDSRTATTAGHEPGRRMLLVIQTGEKPG